MTTENYIEEIHKLKLKIMDSFPDLLEFNNLIEMRDYLIRKSVKQEFLEDLKEFREIHPIAITALLGGKSDEHLQEYTDKVIDTVYEFLISHFEKDGK